jgi:hypothetical protein
MSNSSSPLTLLIKFLDKHNSNLAKAINVNVELRPFEMFLALMTKLKIRKAPKVLDIQPLILV